MLIGVEVRALGACIRAPHIAATSMDRRPDTAKAIRVMAIRNT